MFRLYVMHDMCHSVTMACWTMLCQLLVLSCVSWTSWEVIKLECMCVPKSSSLLQLHCINEEKKLMTIIVHLVISFEICRVKIYFMTTLSTNYLNLLTRHMKSSVKRNKRKKCIEYIMCNLLDYDIWIALELEQIRKKWHPFYAMFTTLPSNNLPLECDHNQTSKKLC
jgi:hypothetical protein